MQRTNHAWRRRVVFPVLFVLLAAGSAEAAGPKCLGPYTITSNNYGPGPEGDDVRDWTGDFSVNLGVTTAGGGTLIVSVEAKLPGGTFASLGTMGTTGIAQFHGPLDRLRFAVAGCTSCLATVVACINKGD